MQRSLLVYKVTPSVLLFSVLAFPGIITSVVNIFLGVPARPGIWKDNSAFAGPKMPV